MTGTRFDQRVVQMCIIGLQGRLSSKKTPAKHPQKVIDRYGDEEQ
jgi:hypothetical protein